MGSSSITNTSTLTNVVFFAIVIIMNDKQNQPRKIDEILAEGFIGEPDQARKEAVASRDLNSEVAGLAEDVHDTAEIARTGVDLDPARIAEQNDAFLLAKSEQESNRQESTDR